MGEKKRRQALAMAGQAGEANRSAAASAPIQWLNAGLQAHRAGRLVEAINAYNEALRRAPDLTEAQHYQGLALLQSGQVPIGLHLMKQSVAKPDAKPEFHFNLGNALREIDAQAALQEFRTACTLNPGDHGAALAYGELLAEMGQRDEAIAALSRAHGLQPQRWETLRTLASLYYDGNRIAEAQQRLAAGAALHPPLAETAVIGQALPGMQGWAPGRNGLPDIVSGDELEQFARDADLHVVDDFLADPDAYRRAALSLPFQDRNYAGQNYPGIQTKGVACQDIMARIAGIIGVPIKFRSPDNGCYRISFGTSKARTDIHIDNESDSSANQYAAVLYLNLPHQCQGGTSFWRHRPTGWDRRPAREELRARGYDDYRAFRRRWLPNTEEIAFNQLKEKRSDWDLLLEVPMRYNRLVFYRSHFFHSISEVFGSSKEDGRFVQLFTFDVMAD